MFFFGIIFIMEILKLKSVVVLFSGYCELYCIRVMKLFFFFEVVFGILYCNFCLFIS